MPSVYVPFFYLNVKHFLRPGGARGLWKASIPSASNRQGPSQDGNSTEQPT